jgi:hypothetical protein
MILKVLFNLAQLLNMRTFSNDFFCQNHPNFIFALKHNKTHYVSAKPGTYFIQIIEM